MAQQECIKVPFAFSAEDVQGCSKYDSITNLIASYYGMPWLTYLLDNAIKIDSVKEYVPAADMYDVYFHFYLDPKKATYYRMKYAQ